MDIDSVVNDKIEKDADFQTSLADLSDEDKATAINTKRSELVKSEFESLSKKAEENDKKFKDQQIRAQKAEEEAKKAKGEVRPEGLSTKDTLYLAKAPIHEEDVEEIVEYAKKMGMGVKEAHEFYKPILAVREETRKTAAVANTSSSRNTVTKPSDADLLNKARSGELPEDDASIDRLMKAKLGKK